MRQIKLPSFQYRQAYEIKVDSIDDVNRLLFDIDIKDNIYYRGMTNYDHICISTFYRYYLSLNPDIEWKETEIAYGKSIKLPAIDSEDYSRVSFDILDEFEKNLFDSGIKEQSLNSVIYLAQHYGLPTNLIDFTLDPKIALYFACSRDFDDDCLVYAYDIFAHIRGFVKNYITGNALYLENEGGNKMSDDERFQYFFDKFTTSILKECPSFATPIVSSGDIFHNKRIQAQAGAFVYHNQNVPFDNLMYLASSSTNYNKRKVYRIKKELKQEILALLDSEYNINEERLLLDDDILKKDLESRKIFVAIEKTKEKFKIKNDVSYKIDESNKDDLRDDIKLSTITKKIHNGLVYENGKYKSRNIELDEYRNSVNIQKEDLKDKCIIVTYTQNISGFEDK